MRAAPLLLLLAAAAPAPDAPPRLAGVVVTPDYRAALFERQGGGLETVQEGEAITGFAVRTIGRDGVVLERAGRTLTLQPGAPATGSPPADPGGVTFGVQIRPQGPPDD